MDKSRGRMRISEGRPASRKNRPAPTAVTVGVLVGLDEAGVPLVDCSGSRQGFLPARTIVGLSEKQVGQEVVLSFEDGDPARPIILGVMQKAGRPQRQLHVCADGETITLTADKEIVLKCGKATIQLGQDGKIVLRGTYLLSRSSGVNRIQGGSVQLN